MFQQLFHIIIISITCIIWGVPVILLLNPSIKRDAFWYHSPAGLFAFLFFCGCLLISIFSSWIYLVAPLKFSYLAFATILLILYLYLRQKNKIISILRENFKNKTTLSFIPIVFIIVSMILFVLLSSLQTANGDTQIYHMQIIRWQSEYPVVPGVANLYPRFALGSNWFNLVSLFYWPNFKSENFTYLNAAFVAWFFTWLFAKWHFYLKKTDAGPNDRLLISFYFFLLVYGMFDWQLYRDAANSTNYDFAVTAFTMIIASFFIEGIFLNQSRNKFSFVVLLVSLCMISFKLSGIFILLLVLYHILLSRKSVPWMRIIFAGAVILLPVFIKNYISSGYPLFPSTLAVNNPDWMLPAPIASGFYRYIVLSNRFYNYEWSFIKKMDHTTFNWIPYWFNGILWKHKIILALAIASGFFLFKKINLSVNLKQLRGVVAILLLMMMAWFFTAPDPGRFGYGILLSLSSLVAAFFISPFLKARFYFLVLLAASISIALYTVKKSKPIFNDPRYLLYPDTFKQPTYKVIRLNNINLNLPTSLIEDARCHCYFTPLPCIIQVNPFLQPRGQSLKDGFRMSPSPDSSFISHYLY